MLGVLSIKPTEPLQALLPTTFYLLPTSYKKTAQIHYPIVSNRVGVLSIKPTVPLQTPLPTTFYLLEFCHYSFILQPCRHIKHQEVPVLESFV